MKVIWLKKKVKIYGYALNKWKDFLEKNNAKSLKTKMTTKKKDL